MFNLIIEQTAHLLFISPHNEEQQILKSIPICQEQNTFENWQKQHPN